MWPGHDCDGLFASGGFALFASLCSTLFPVDPNDSTCHDVNHCDLSISLF